MSSEKLIFIPHPNSKEINNLSDWLSTVDTILDQFNNYSSSTAYYFYIYQSDNAFTSTPLTINSIETILKAFYSRLITYLSNKDPSVANWDINIGFDRFSRLWVSERVRQEEVKNLEIWLPTNIELNRLISHLNLNSEFNEKLKNLIINYKSKFDNNEETLNINLVPVPELNTVKFDYFGNYGALGGTFDHLHPGHKILLSISALAPSNELFCGVMAPSTLKSKSYGELLESIDTRIENVAKFLKFFNWALNVEVAPINDGFGPTITNPDFDTLILTEETAKGGQLVNDKRVELGWKPLKNLVVSLISAESEGENKTKEDEIKNKLSSTIIRRKLNEQK